MAEIRRLSEHQSVLRSNKTTSPNFRIDQMRCGGGFDRLVRISLAEPENQNIDGRCSITWLKIPPMSLSDADANVSLD